MTQAQIFFALGLITISSCKSRYGFTEYNKEAATARSAAEDAMPTTTPPSSNPGARGDLPSTTSDSQPNPSDPSSSGGETQSEPAPKSPGGVVVGIEVSQGGKLVNTVKTGQAVTFKPTPWTRDTSATSGCDTHQGIVQASWTIGSRQAADLLRYAGQECRPFDYTGTFTKPGQVIVQLDVMSSEGEDGHSEVKLTVEGEANSSSTSNPSPNPSSTSQPTGPSQAPRNSPTQK